MTLNAAELGQKLHDAATTNLAGNTRELWLKIATEIISHIQKNGVVNVVVNTAGSPTNQTGTGVGTLS